MIANMLTGIEMIGLIVHPLAVPSEQDSLELAGRASDAIRAIADAGIHLLLSGHHHRALSGPIALPGPASRNAIAAWLDAAIDYGAPDQPAFA